MTLSFRPGMSACAFITDGLYRYLKEHRGEQPVELVLHPDHTRMLCDELHVRRSGIHYDGYEFNGVPVLEDPCCRTPWLVTEDGQRWGAVALSSRVVGKVRSVPHRVCAAAYTTNPSAFSFNK